MKALVPCGRKMKAAILPSMIAILSYCSTPPDYAEVKWAMQREEVFFAAHKSREGGLPSRQDRP